MKRVLVSLALLAVASLGLSCTAKADSFIGSGNVIWTLNGVGSDGSGGFLVTLQVDASNPSASAGTSIFNIFSVQFSSDGHNATGVSLVNTSTNTTGWSYSGLGNVNQCGSGHLPFFCFQTSNGIEITGGTDSGSYTFLFDVTGLSAAPNVGDIQALQGSLPGSNGKYAISQSFAVPEPSSLTLLGFCLAGIPFLRRKFL